MGKGGLVDGLDAAKMVEESAAVAMMVVKRMIANVLKDGLID